MYGYVDTLIKSQLFESFESVLMCARRWTTSSEGYDQISTSRGVLSSAREAVHAAIKRSRQGDITFWLSELVRLTSALE